MANATCVHSSRGRLGGDPGPLSAGTRGYFVHHHSWLLDRTVAQVVSCRSVSVIAWVQLQERLNGICRVTAAGLSPSFPLAMSFHHCSPHIHSPLLPTHSLTFAPHTFTNHCSPHIHSPLFPTHSLTIAPHTFTHHCSPHIHSPLLPTHSLTHYIRNTLNS